MAFVTHQPRLFGLDLSGFTQALAMAWQGLLASPLWNWLRPHTSCSLRVQAGQPPLRALGPHTPARPHAQAAKLRHTAVLMPEDLLLRQSIQLPHLPAAQLHDALSLHAHNLSPFAATDLVWTHRAIDQGGSPTHQIVLTSRPLLEQHVQNHYPELPAGSWEAWCLADPASPGTSPYLVLPGFAEVSRQKSNRLRAWLTGALLVLALLMVAAAALSPSIQLYQRALQARQAMENLRTQAGPALAQRETYLRLTERHRQLMAQVGQPVSSLRVLDMLTRGLPDDTALQTFQLQGHVVQITGYTPNTASLMKALGKVSGVKGVRAPAPATKPPGITREVFNLELQIDPPTLLTATP